MTIRTKRQKDFFVRDNEPYGNYSGAIYEVSAEKTITEAIETLDNLQLASVVGEAAQEYFRRVSTKRLTIDKTLEAAMEGYNEEEIAGLIFQYAIAQYHRKQKESNAAS